MPKLVKFFAIAALVAGAFVMTPDTAAAQHHHGGGGHWHGSGGWRGGGWGPGFVFGLGSAWGWGGYPYSYYEDYYYPRPELRVGARGRLAQSPLGPTPRLALLVTPLK